MGPFRDAVDGDSDPKQCLVCNTEIPSIVFFGVVHWNGEDHEDAALCQECFDKSKWRFKQWTDLW